MRPPARPRGQAGSAAVLVLAACSVLVLLGAVAAALAAVGVARHRAASAADLAALAAADRALQGERSACDRARRAATAVGAEVAACRLDGDDAVVTVRVEPTGRLAALGAASATARAGPRRPRG